MQNVKSFFEKNGVCFSETRKWTETVKSFLKRKGYVLVKQENGLKQRNHNHESY